MKKKQKFMATFLTSVLVGSLLISAFGMWRGQVGAASFQSIQKGSVSMSSSTMTATLGTAVDTSKAYVTCDNRGDSNNPATIVTRCQLAGSTTVAIKVTNPSVNNIVNWQVVEFNSGVSVQRGLESFGTADTTRNVTISSVTTSSTFVVTGMSTEVSSNSGDQQWTVRSQLTSSTNLELLRNSSGNATHVDWQVVSFTDGSVSVQHGLASLSSGTSTTATISSVDTSKTFLLFSLAADSKTSGIEGHYSTTGELTNATTLTFSRGVSSAMVISIAYQAITFTGGINVQRGTQVAATGVGTTMYDITIPQAIDTSRSFSVLSASTTSTVSGTIDDVSWTSQITSATNLRIERATSAVDSTVSWQVIEFVSNPTFSQQDYRWYDNADTLGFSGGDWWNPAWAARRKVTIDASTKTIETRVASSGDDAEEWSNGTMDVTSTDLELVYDSASTLDQQVGMRFIDLDIPQGATITNAYVQFTTDEINTGATNLTVYGQAADSAATFTTTSSDISSRTKTGASVSWSNVPAWNTVGQAVADQRTPNLSTLVQEIVNRGGWANGNDMAFVITGTGERTAVSYELAPAQAPLLHIEYALSGTLTDFPVRVSLNSSNIDYTKTQNAGQDLRFVGSDGSAVLAHEIETWNEAGISEVWVKVPQIIVSSTTNYIYMYYGNGSVTDGQDPASVWSNGYTSVWHMSQDPSSAAPQVKDSTVNANHGTAQGSMASGDSSVGAVGTALKFDGVNDYISTTNQYSSPQNLTIETWSKDSTSSGKALITFESDQTGENSLNSDRSIYRDLFGRIRAASDDGAYDYVGSSNGKDDSQWHYAAATIDDTNNELKLYVDGLHQETKANNNAAATSGYWRMGYGRMARYFNGQDGYFPGYIDEVRVSSTVRSALWVSVQHASMSNTLNSFGVEEGNTGGWWNASWTSRVKVAFNNSASSENLINLPVRVSLSSSIINYNSTQNAGQDIRFIDADGTILAYEIENWDETGTSEVWVKVPLLDAGSVTDHVYMYYGNATAPDAQNPSGVWDDGYVGVWHMDETTGTSLNDSTSNANTATKPSATSPMPTSGKVNGAQDFDGTSSNASVNDSVSIDSISSQLTMEAWVRRDADKGTWEQIMQREVGSTSAEHYALAVNPTDGYTMYVNSSNGAQAVTRSVNGTGSLDYVAGTYDGSFVRLYVNGVLVNSVAHTGTIATDTTFLNIGAGQNNGTGGSYIEYWDGLIDEARLSRSARSAEWIEAQYVSMNNSMNSFGTVETVAEGEDIVAISKENAPLVLGMPKTIRLRMNLSIEDEALLAGFQSFRLQFATSTIGTWTDVGSIGSGTQWRFADNPTVSSGATLIGSKLSTSTSTQSYSESNPTVANPRAEAAGGRAEWDFVLDSTNAVSATTYYFRMIESDGTVLNSYARYPQIAVVYPENKLRHGNWFEINSGAEQQLTF